MAEASRLGLAVRPPHVNHSGSRFTLAWEGEQGVLWMGLRQVRDLRRVPLQAKEIAHLIQCGALGGLGEADAAHRCRAALLAEATEVERAGSALQMTLFGEETLGRPDVAPEAAEERLAWERRLLGYPVSVLCDPSVLVGGRLPEYTPLKYLAESGSHPVNSSRGAAAGLDGR